MNELEELLGEYWEIGYSEGATGVSRGDEANEVLHRIRELFKAKPAGNLKLRSWYSPAEGCYYISYRSIPERVRDNMPLVKLYEIVGDCQKCQGSRGGEHGNSQWVGGILMCDYCHSDSMGRK